MENIEISIQKIFGSCVQKYRKKYEFTQTELAEKLGVSQKHLSDIENGIKFPSPALIEKLSKELNVMPALLFDGSNIDPNNLSNKVANLVMMNLQPKINVIAKDLYEIKTMLKNMKITVNTNLDESPNPYSQL